MDTEERTALHGGRLVARRLRAQGVDTVFTLSGGHLFSIYDGCRAEGIALVDTRHEATAAFAAEGFAKVTRSPGVAALTAGPGVTNGLSAMGAALQSHSPLVVLGGRAPAWRWGQGSLQEIDHLPFVRPLARFAATAESPGEIPGLIDEALGAALRAPGGPAFVDFPLDHVFSEATEAGEPADLPSGTGTGEPDGAALERAVKLLAEAERPVVMAGSDLWWGHGELVLLELVEALRIPVFLNGLARGCVPADHELAFSRTRSAGLKGADVALVIGVPMDFRLGFGAAFGEDTDIVVVDRAEPDRSHPRPPAAELYGALPGVLDALRAGIRPDASVTAAWVAELRERETEAREAEAAERGDDRAPLHPMRLYAELSGMLDRDAIVVGDGGDFVSYAGRVIDSYTPGCWLDPGPFGCLGAGPGRRSERPSPGRAGRSCCCSATARSDSAAWSGTRSCATTSPSWGWSATTASGGWRSTPWSSCTATPWSPTCGRRPATTRSWRRSAATASSSGRPASCARRSSGRSRRAVPRS